MKHARLERLIEGCTHDWDETGMTRTTSYTYERFTCVKCGLVCVEEWQKGVKGEKLVNTHYDDTNVIYNQLDN